MASAWLQTHRVSAKLGNGCAWHPKTQVPYSQAKISKSEKTDEEAPAIRRAWSRSWANLASGPVSDSRLGFCRPRASTLAVSATSFGLCGLDGEAQAWGINCATASTFRSLLANMTRSWSIISKSCFRGRQQFGLGSRAWNFCKLCCPQR